MALDDEAKIDSPLVALHPSSFWYSLDNVYYQVIEFASAPFPHGSSPTNHFVAGDLKLRSIAPNGGPIVACLDQETSTVDKPLILWIFSSFGSKLRTIEWFNGWILDVFWTIDWKLVVVNGEGDVFVYSLINSDDSYVRYSFGERAKIAGLIQVQMDLYTEKLIGLTSENDFIQIDLSKSNGFSEVFIEKPASFLAQSPQCWCMVRDKFSPNELDPNLIIYAVGNSLTLLGPDIKRTIQINVKDPSATVLSLAASSGGGLIAGLTSESSIFVVTLDLQKIVSEFSIVSSIKAIQVKELLWCGSDAICLIHAETSTIYLFGPNGSLLVIGDDAIPRTKNIVCRTETDGLRIISNGGGNELLSRVPDCLIQLWSIGSTHPASKLIEAMELISAKRFEGELVLYELLQEQEAQLAIDICLLALVEQSHYIHPYYSGYKTRLLRAVKLGIAYFEMNQAKLVLKSSLDLLASTSQLYQSEIAISWQEFSQVGIKGALELLTCCGKDEEALLMAERHAYPPVPILTHWAINQLKQDHTNISDLCTMIMDKFEQFHIFHPPIAEIAKAAIRAEKLHLAAMLLEFEDDKETKIPILLHLGREVEAIKAAIQSGSPNLTYQLVDTFKRKYPLPEFIRLLSSSQSGGQDALEIYCRRMQDSTVLKNLYYQEDRRTDLSQLLISQSNRETDSDVSTALLIEAIETQSSDYSAFADIASKTVPSTLGLCMDVLRSQIKLREFQKVLEVELDQEFTGKSLADTIFLLLKQRQDTHALQLKADHEMSESIYGWLCIRAAIALKEFSKLAGIKPANPIGIVEECIRTGQLEESLPFIASCGSTIQPMLYIRVCIAALEGTRPSGSHHFGLVNKIVEAIKDNREVLVELINWCPAEQTLLLTELGHRLDLIAAKEQQQKFQ